MVASPRRSNIPKELDVLFRRAEKKKIELTEEEAQVLVNLLLRLSSSVFQDQMLKLLRERPGTS